MFAILPTRLKLLYYFSACCNYSYLKNLIKLRLHCLTYNRYIILVCRFNKGFLIKFGQLHFKQFCATRSKCLTQMHYSHSQVTCCRPERVLYLLLAVDENAYDLFGNSCLILIVILMIACCPLVPKFAGSNPAEAFGFLRHKNPQRAFLRRGSKAVGPMS